MVSLHEVDLCAARPTQFTHYTCIQKSIPESKKAFPFTP